MTRRVSVREAGFSLPALVESVTATDEPIVMEDDGESVAVLVSPREYQKFRAEEDEEDDVWAVLDRIRSRMPDRDPEEVMREVTEIVEEVRQEMYEEEQRARAGQSRR